MNCRRLLLAALCLIALDLAAQEGVKAGSPSRLIIVQPGYPGSTKDAAGFIERLSRYLEEKTGLKGIVGAYYNEEAPALAACREGAVGVPGFGVVSLGFYLKHRSSLGLRPLLQAKPKDNFVIVGRAGELKGLQDLKGQEVAGGPLHELELLGRLVLAGKADPATWQAKPTLATSRTLRDLLDRKKYRAVVLTGRDYRAFEELYRTKGLEKTWESEYYPPALLVAFLGKDPASHPGAGQASPRSGEPRQVPKEVESIAKALAGLSEDPRGKEILESMAAEGFERIAPDWLKEVEGRYDAQKHQVQGTGEGQKDAPRPEGERR